MSETTIAGNTFIREPLKNYADNTQISLPGIGEKNSKRLKDFGITNEVQLFGQYLAFNMDDDLFISYLVEEVKLVFVSNKYGKAEDYQKKLCHTLQEKYNILKEY
jgi:hypothetical protein